jgi:hypothetical protein
MSDIPPEKPTETTGIETETTETTETTGIETETTETIFLNYVLDRSGSMFSCGFSVFEGLKKTIQDKISFSKEMNMKLRVCIHAFNHTVTRINVPEDPTEWTSEHYQLIRTEIAPNGWTSLYDAIKQSIEQNRDATKDIEKPNTFMIIITDGCDNRSELDCQQIKSEITTHITYGSEYIYIGANIDAQQSGIDIGIQPDACMQFTPNPDHTTSVFNSIGQAIQRSVTGEDADGPRFRLHERQRSCTADDQTRYSVGGRRASSAPRLRPTKLDFGDAIPSGNFTRIDNDLNIFDDNGKDDSNSIFDWMGQPPKPSDTDAFASACFPPLPQPVNCRVDTVGEDSVDSDNFVLFGGGNILNTDENKDEHKDGHIIDALEPAI